MARSPQEVYNQLIQIKESEPALSGFTSTSITALWRIVFAATATGISVFEQIQDQFKIDLEYQKQTTSIYTPYWWNDRMLKYFQYAPGDTDRGVIQINDQFQTGYNIVDPSKRIIAFSATKQANSNRQVTIKVAKDNGSGNPIQLTSDELLAAAGFVDRTKGAGLLISVVSFPADLLTLDIDVYFNGQYVLATVKNNVQNAITAFLKQLKFDGTIQLSSLVDAIQAVQGVTDCLVNSANGTPDGGDATIFNRVYNTKAGYASFDIKNSLINMIQDSQ